MTRADQRKFHYIYKITRNDGSGKYYIGMHSTDDLEDGYFGSGQLLWKSIKKHGMEKHSKEILEFLPSRKELKVRERILVNEEILNDPLCMNLKLGGEGGAQSDPQVLKIISDKAKQRTGSKNSFFGKQHSVETRKKIADTRTGKPLSEGVRQKLSNSLSGRSGEWTHTEETKNKLKRAWEHRRLTPVSEEARKKMSAARTGKGHHLYHLTSPTGESHVTQDLVSFCLARGLAYSSLTACLRTGKALGGKNIGWQIRKQEIDE